MYAARGRVAVSLAIPGAAFALLYWPVLQKLALDWARNDDYSYGFLIAPIAAYFVVQRRRRLEALPAAPSLWGLAVVGASLALLVLGLLGAELFLTRIAMIATLAGGVLFVLGWRHLGVLSFPIAFLLLMIPMPTIVANQIVFPLQLLASRAGELSLSAAGIPVLREGNLIVLASTTLEVAEACSGIRSLMSLLTVGIVYAYFSDRRFGVRATIALSTIPIAIVTNGMRIAGTGFASHYYGAAGAEGFLHAFAGWLIFVVAFVMLAATARVLQLIVPSRASQEAEPV